MSVERFGERIPGGAVCAEKLVIPEFFRRMRYTTAGGGSTPRILSYHIHNRDAREPTPAADNTSYTISGVSAVLSGIHGAFGS